MISQWVWDIQQDLYNYIQSLLLFANCLQESKCKNCDAADISKVVSVSLDSSKMEFCVIAVGTESIRN